MKEYIVQAYAQETIDSFDANNAPEIVRCKDCKRHIKPGDCDYGNKPDDWFCADGQKRSE